MHLGKLPLETLARGKTVDLGNVPHFEPLSFRRPETPHSLINAMCDHQAMMDTIRDGLVNPLASEAPSDPLERTQHLKSFAYFFDASIVGACRIPSGCILTAPVRNPDSERLAEDLRTKQPKTLASGLDVVLADLKEGLNAPRLPDGDFTHALVLVYANPRLPRPDERGASWIADAGDHRSALRAAETAVVLGNYIRFLGYEARAHTMSSSDFDLNRLAVAAGVATVQDSQLVAPFVGEQFAVAVVTTTFELEPDLPLSKLPTKRPPAFSNRDFRDGIHPMEKIKRVETPTTFIDEARVPRVPKRTDMFGRALFGDMGKKLQDRSSGGLYVRRAPTSMAMRRVLGAFTLLSGGEPGQERVELDPQEAHDLVKAATYFLGVDATGISRCPEWTWYSHDAAGQEIVPVHDQAISMLTDQGHETLEGSSGDDWIATAVSMKAYLRFSLLGGVISRQLRNLGYKAKAHTVTDGEVLQPPLVLLSGLGEASRIGEVILHPFLGPRVKSGVVTTDLPMTHDKPIDFGLQSFCQSCKKCARECPAGAISAGPKLMFNGYEIWKPDAEKCMTYRLNLKGGPGCGRCMKTCPWNLEGILADKAFRWMAINVPSAAPVLSKLDDMLERGSLNPVKKWWWDLEVQEDGAYRVSRFPPSTRSLQKELDIKYEDQTLAAYPATIVPHPYSYPYQMDREDGIEAYQALLTVEEYKKRLAQGDESAVHTLRDFSDSPVLHVKIAKAEQVAEGVTKYVLESLDGSDLPAWEAGAHIDVVIAPEFLRQYSICSDPADPSTYQIGVLREEGGRGGSRLMHRIFNEGRKIFISKPINHFPLHEDATKSFLMGGGIGITPMIAMAHRLHKLGANFEFHYSGRSREKMAFLHDLANVAWADKVHLHISSESGRARFDDLLSYSEGAHVYTCGAEHYMQAVLEAASQTGFPEDNRHLEYFSVPEQPDYENHPFKIKLARSGKVLDVRPDQGIADVLQENGIPLNVKCADGVCGTCKCGLISGEVEHRDFVLSNKQRKTEIITCQSRAKMPEGTLELDL